MKYSILFGSSSIAFLIPKQQGFEVGSLLAINVPYYLWNKNSMCNISQSTHSKDPNLGMHMDILTNFWLNGKNL